MKCPKCGAEAHYFPQEGFIIGWGYIVCDRGHSTKAYHLIVGMNGTDLVATIFLNKEDLEEAIEGSEKLKSFYEYVKNVHGL